jgi:hypothetical protein
MKTETIQFELPNDIVESAKRIGFTKNKISEMSKSFVILEVVANSGKLDKIQAEKISDNIKAVSWKKTKKKLGI